MATIQTEIKIVDLDVFQEVIKRAKEEIENGSEETKEALKRIFKPVIREGKDAD